jgi:SnoaL-like domain
VFPHLAATAHTTSNPVVRIDGDRATCSVHMQAKHVRPTARGEGWYDLGGYYDFDLVRRDGAWLISRLVHTTTWESGNPRIMQEAAAAAASD